MKKQLTVGALAVGLLFSPVASSAYHGTTTPSTYSSPTTTFGSSAYSVARTDKGMTFEGKVSGHQKVTLRVSASPITTQTGWYYPNVAVASDGTVRIVTNEQGAEKNLYWQLESATDRNSIITSGELSAVTSGATPAPSPSPSDPAVTPAPTPSPTPTPTPTPTTPPVTGGDFTNGSGGALTNTTWNTFSANGVTSQYHIYASGLDWSKKVGIMVYTDGSGEYGLKNPSSSYLLGGTNGLVNVAKRNNMILLTPLAPGNGCGDGGGTCWYQDSGGYTRDQKVDWSAALVQNIYGKYNIDKSRVALGGYSSGAQWSSMYFGPEHASKFMTDGVVVPISYGGAPGYGVPKNFPTSFKDSVVFSWDTGSADPATNSQWGVKGGYDWYTANGFDTQRNIVPNLGHGRSDFGSVMDREIKEHVKPA